MDPTAIDDFGRIGQRLKAAVAGLTRDDLLATPVPGTWSIQQIAVHLMDSHLTAMDRMKRMIAMRNPLLLAYDESAFAAELRYDLWPIEDVVAIVDLAHRNFANVLKSLPPKALQRQGVHNEDGTKTVGPMIRGYVEHFEHHHQKIAEKRSLLGKPL